MHRMSGQSCVIKISEVDLSQTHRNWTGNDEGGGYRTMEPAGRHRSIPSRRVVRVSESPLDIRLRWKRASGAPVNLIGCFRLDLRELLAKGFVRKEDEDTIRLQFV